MLDRASLVSINFWASGSIGVAPSLRWCICSFFVYFLVIMYIGVYCCIVHSCFQFVSILEIVGGLLP